MIEEKKIKTAHNIILENRNNLSVSGVNDVDSFDEKQIAAFTEMGFLTIKGTNLHINRFNTETGELSLSGTVDGLFYSNHQKQTASGFLTKLFHWCICHFPLPS